MIAPPFWIWGYVFLIIPTMSMWGDSGVSRMCKRRGRKPPFGWKRGVSFTLLKKMHENTIFSPIKGGGRTPGTPYAGSATGRSITATCKIRPKSFFGGLLDMFLTCQHGHWLTLRIKFYIKILCCTLTIKIKITPNSNFKFYWEVPWSWP